MANLSYDKQHSNVWIALKRLDQNGWCKFKQNFALRNAQIRFIHAETLDCSLCSVYIVVSIETRIMHKGFPHVLTDLISVLILIRAFHLICNDKQTFDVKIACM